MIFLLHNDAKKFLKATKDKKVLSLQSKSLTDAFWEVAKKYPEELIIWRDQNVTLQLADSIKEYFAHELIMASYAVENQFIPEQIGYIDQLPFINPNYDVVYPTWRMSTDIGGVFGNTALQFREIFKKIKNFGYLINSIAKTGQQNGLFCYSNPNLIKNRQKNKLLFNGSIESLFKFVGQHYKKEWLWVLLFCLGRYEKRFSVFYLLKALSTNSFFRNNIELPVDSIQINKENLEATSIDVIVPTLFRAEHVKNLLEDLSKQSKLPDQVIIVEQDPDPTSASNLHFLNNNWPFKIVHHFVHKTGACSARNLALKEVKSEWLLFADDDIRIEFNLLERSLKEISRLGVNCLNLNSLQPGEKSVFYKIKQWGAFGSANALVNSDYALRCKFAPQLEFGFGEDIDFGLQLRNKGCDILYHPNLQFVHLKAARGGFRTEGINEWKEEKIEPKPSPTMMFLIRKYYSFQMLAGYKVSLFLKFYRKQKLKDPFRYLKIMKKRWEKSERLADNLMKTHEGNNNGL